MRTFAVVTPYLPAPANTGGRIRIHALARALARHGAVDLFARYWPIELAPEAGDTVGALALYRETHLRQGDLGAAIPGFAPRRVRAACPWRLRRDLERAHARWRYDAVVVCHSYAAATALRLRDTVLALDEHNVESAYARMMAPGDRVEAARLARWERRVWNRVHTISAVTPDDARAIGRGARVEPAVIANGAELKKIEFVAPSARAGHDVLFVGSMSHPPNVRAACELAREVLPLVRERAPDATLTLCGRAPAPEVRALAGEHVRVTGTVEDIAPYLSRARVYANLLRDGAGSSLKVPEALAAGVPLVSTAVGVRGFELTDGVHFSAAETPRAFADAIVRAWDDAASAERRALAAREVARAYDWELLGDRFARHVLDAVESRRGRS